MASCKFRESRRLDTKQLVRPEFNTRLGVTKPFQCLVDDRLAQNWRWARRFLPAPVLLDTCLLISDRLTGCFTDRCSDLGHTQSLRTGDLKRATLMATLGEKGESNLGDILDIDRRKAHVIEWQQQQAFAGDDWRLTQIDLHELARTQMRPDEAGLLQIPLDFFMHSREAKILCIEADAGFFA